MIKSELRRIYLEKRKSLSAEEREKRSLRITERFFERFNPENIHFLHLFLAIEENGEIDTSIIYRRLWREFPNTVAIVPRVNLPNLTLDNVRFTPDSALVKNKWHISEPVGGELIETRLIDAALVPLLCVDKRGFRVGYGKGLYDRFLSQCRADCLKIGLSFFEPADKIADAENFDVRLDFCVTPDIIIDFES